MFRFVYSIGVVVAIGAFGATAHAQTSQSQEDEALQNGLLQEQAAICASYARIMEYSGLLEQTQGELWRERRFFAGAMLRSSINSSTGTQPTNTEIDGVINEYSSWMLDLFSANPVIAESDKIAEKDKLRDYISNFCTGLFINADKAIAKVRPDLFATQVATVPDENAMATESSDKRSSEQVSRLLKENVRLQQSLNELKRQLADQTAALAQQPKPAASATPTAGSALPATTASNVNTNIILGEVMDAPPRKPELPLYLTAETGDVITPAATKSPKDVGLTQIQLASYSSIKNANRGLNILTKELADNADTVELLVTAAKLPTGRNVFRVVSAPLPLADAQNICSFFWGKKYACIIKMNASS
ncbi:MAG: hypothetical protein J4F41_06130 [Alphaproteobacteria bacterium]|nr:hypothetical protein [Alphaproteobacteria bacterium]